MDARFAAVLIVSGGVGYSAEQVVRAALAQFPRADVALLHAPQLRCADQIPALVAQAESAGALIAHTLVDPALRRGLVRLAWRRGVPEVDLAGPLLRRLAAQIGQEPLGEPGRYRAQQRALFDRIAAIEYTLDHDDGEFPEEWPRADLLLAGVSCVGKTPLAAYLAVLGWKVACVPLGPSAPPQLARPGLPPAVGLTIAPDRLAERRHRRATAPGEAGDGDVAALAEELARAQRQLGSHHIPVVDVTDRPLESVAAAVLGAAERARSAGVARG